MLRKEVGKHTEAGERIKECQENFLYGKHPIVTLEFSYLKLQSTIKLFVTWCSNGFRLVRPRSRVGSFRASLARGRRPWCCRSGGLCQTRLLAWQSASHSANNACTFRYNLWTRRLTTKKQRSWRNKCGISLRPTTARSQNASATSCSTTTAIAKAKVKRPMTSARCSSFALVIQRWAMPGCECPKCSLSVLLVPAERHKQKKWARCTGSSMLVCNRWWHKRRRPIRQFKSAFGSVWREAKKFRTTLPFHWSATELQNLTAVLMASFLMASHSPSLKSTCFGALTSSRHWCLCLTSIKKSASSAWANVALTHWLASCLIWNHRTASLPQRLRQWGLSWWSTTSCQHSTRGTIHSNATSGWSKKPSRAAGLCLTLVKTLSKPATSLPSRFLIRLIDFHCFKSKS